MSHINTLVWYFQPVYIVPQSEGSSLSTTASFNAIHAIHESPMSGRQPHCVRTTATVRQPCGAEHPNETTDTRELPAHVSGSGCLNRAQAGRRQAPCCTCGPHQPQRTAAAASHASPPQRHTHAATGRGPYTCPPAIRQQAPPPKQLEHLPPAAFTPPYPSDHPATPASTDNLKNTVHSLLFAEGTSSICAEESSSLFAEEASSRPRARAAATASRCA